MFIFDKGAASKRLMYIFERMQKEVDSRKTHVPLSSKMLLHMLPQYFLGSGQVGTI